MRTFFFVVSVALSVLAVSAAAQVNLLNVPGAASSGGTGSYDPAAPGQLGSSYGQLSTYARSYAGGQAINVLVLGDGYTQSESSRFFQVANRAAQAIYANPVVRSANAYQKIRFWPYFIASATSGASSARKGTVSTALGATYADRYQGDTSIWVDFQKTWSIARSIQGANFQYVLVLVNCRQYAATQWSTGVCVISDFDRLVGVRNPVTFEDIVCHELLGHTIAGLWDEYVYGSVPSSNIGASPNCDQSAQYPKWYDLMGWQWADYAWAYVGAYAGCAHSSLYRPTYANCKMNTWASQPFCPVCRRQILAVLGEY